MRFPKQYAKILYELTEDVSAKDMDAVLREYILFLQREQALGKLDYIISAFESYAKEKAGIPVLAVESARPLEKKEVNEIRLVFGDKAEINCGVRPWLLGGIVIRTGDRIIDGSLRVQLQRLAGTMLS